MKNRSPVQVAALLTGVVFVLVGILGFVPGVTAKYADLSFAGHESQAQLLGLFQISILHNIVHLLFGLAGIAAAATVGGSRGFLIGGGAIYLLLAGYGFAISQNSAANFVPVNAADNLLHVVLGVGMLAAGLVLPKVAGGATAAQA
jgi:hypothetical protein